MNIENFPPEEKALSSESDVEQKFLYPILSQPVPHGLGIPQEQIQTKPNITALEIDKGASRKRYHPDYVILTGGLPVMIVEAKKAGEDLADAVRECRLYASEFNSQYASGVNPCRYCLVSNGIRTELRNWDSDKILAEFSLPECVPSSASFAAFVRLVSYEKLHEAAHDALQRTKKHTVYRAINKVGGYSFQDDQIPYNNFGKILASEFQDIFNPSCYADRKRIVQEAYVRSLRRERYIEEIDRLIHLSCPPGVRPLPDIDDSADPKELLFRFSDLASLQNKTLLLVGDVGSGKTTFVDYLQHIACPEDIKQKLAWVRLDMNNAPVNRNEIYSWCRANLIEGIRNSSPVLDVASLEGLKKLYLNEIGEFDRAEGALFSKDSDDYKRRLADLLTQLKKDPTITLRCHERYLCTGRGKLLLVVFDNCDKRDREEQLLMFEVARWIQAEVRCLVILPVRNTTFELNRDQPPLDTAIKDLVYRIEPPGFQKVLRARLNLVLSQIKQKPKRLTYQVNGMNVEFSSENLDKFLGAIMNTLFKHEKFGRRMIFGLAGWNLRKAFEIFLEFCRSGYIEEGEIFFSQATGNDLHLPRGVVSRVLMRTNKRYYHGDQSYVKNLFQIDEHDPRLDHFVRCRILAWFHIRHREPGPSGHKGYFPLSHLQADLSILGLDEGIVRRECVYLIRNGCLIAEHLRQDELQSSDSVCITPAGHVHLELVQDVHYLAACAEDTWVADNQLCESTHRRITQQPRYHAFRWLNILETAREFVSYLKAIQTTAPALSMITASAQDPFHFDFDKLLHEIDAMIDQHRHRQRSERGNS
jgi:GTPase SAR1 family protein